MIKQLAILVSLPLFLALGSCRKSEIITDPSLEVDNKISAMVDGALVTAKFKVLLQDPVFNTYYVKDQVVETQRLVANGNPQGFKLTFTKLDLRNASFPLVIQFSDNPNTPSVMATYYDEDNEPFGTNINNPDDFIVTINSYKDQVINASFSGNLFSGQTPTQIAQITDGIINLYLVED